MASGGERIGAGRKKGGKNKATLEKQKVQELFNQRVMLHADNLFNAQLSLAVGTQRIFRVDEEEIDGKTKRTHNLVTDADEMKKVLDENDGEDGTVDGKYYLITEVLPDNRAIDSMLNRALGKPKETHEISGANGGAIETNSTVKVVDDLLKNYGNGDKSDRD